MKKKIYICMVFLCTFFAVRAHTDEIDITQGDASVEPQTDQNYRVEKRVLDNGMTVLVHPVHTTPQVSIRLWYHVGSKDEKTGEKGVAHLIEHMIFKGTEFEGKTRISESDINVVTHMLSGSCNAETSYDYTSYVFNFPTHHWKEALPILADCMRNIAFKDDHLNSEMKAVIQELKMGRDNYARQLIQELLAGIFKDHPYHYPVIGFKRDLWSVSGADLKQFYKKHYWPNNATLVVVGDVDPQELFSLAEQHFASIVPDKEYKKEQFSWTPDIVSKSVKLYRAIQQPLALIAYVIPGAQEKKTEVLDCLTWMLGNGKASLLHKKLVDELQLVSSIGAGSFELFDHGLFYIIFEPKKSDDIEKIKNVITAEIDALVEKGIDDTVITRAVKKAKMQYYSKLESIEQQAHEIGFYYLATNDDNYIFDYLSTSSLSTLKDSISAILKEHFRPTLMHSGITLPLRNQDTAYFKQLQEASDAEDTKILSARTRTTPIEPPLYAHTVKVQEPTAFSFPKADVYTLKNGIPVFSYNNPTTPKIDLIVSLRAKSYYDPADKQGLYHFMMEMLLQGTENYSCTELAEAIESRGMSLRAYPGGFSLTLLEEDIPYGLQLLQEVIERPAFNEKDIEKVRQQILVDIKSLWDDPRSIAGLLVRKHVYAGHPYSKHLLGTEASINAITRDDLIGLHKKFITHDGARIALVGSIGEHNVREILDKTLGLWKGADLKQIVFPSLQPIVSTDVNYPLERDQVVLCYAGLSVKRQDPDYDKLMLFDQIFGGGALGSMSSRLFQLREQSGLFYSINGATAAGADEQPGMTFVKTMVSLDRLDEAEHAIKQTIDSVVGTITQQELAEAKRAVITSLVKNFEFNGSIARSFLWLDHYGFPQDYFDKRAASIANITIDDINTAVKKVLHSNKMITVRIGRVGKKDMVTT